MITSLIILVGLWLFGVSVGWYSVQWLYARVMKRMECEIEALKRALDSQDTIDRVWLDGTPIWTAPQLKQEAATAWPETLEWKN